MKIGENAPNAIAFKLKTLSLPDSCFFVSSASRLCGRKNLALDFLICSWYKGMLKNTPACQIGPILGTKRWLSLKRRQMSKIANKLLEKGQLRGNVPNFRTKALAIPKLKGKENREMNTEKWPVFCTTLYRKPMQSTKFDCIWNQLFNWIFSWSYGFEQKIRWEMNFNKRPKVTFFKSPISSPVL